METFDALIAKIRGPAAELGLQARTQRQEIAALIDERETLAAMPPSRAEVADVLCADVQAAAAAFPNAIASHARGIWRKPSRDVTGRRRSPLLWGNNGFVSKNTYGEAGAPLPFALYGLLSGPICDGIRSAVAAMDWPDDSECAPPFEQRMARLAELDRQIGELEEQHSKLRAQAAAAGLQIEQLDALPEPEAHALAKAGKRARRRADG